MIIPLFNSYDLAYRHNTVLRAHLLRFICINHMYYVWVIYMKLISYDDDLVTYKYTVVQYWPIIYNVHLKLFICQQVRGHLCLTSNINY